MLLTLEISLGDDFILTMVHSVSTEKIRFVCHSETKLVASILPRRYEARCQTTLISDLFCFSGNKVSLLSTTRQSSWIFSNHIKRLGNNFSTLTGKILFFSLPRFDSPRKRFLLFFVLWQLFLMHALLFSSSGHWSFVLELFTRL